LYNTPPFGGEPAPAPLSHSGHDVIPREAAQLPRLL
jgi:hypothetical protein